MFKRFMYGPLREAAGAVPDGGGNPPNPGATFDPVAFKAELKSELMGDFNKTLNGFASGLKKDIGKLLEPKEPTPPAGDPPAGDPPVDPPPAKTIAETNANIARLSKQVETLTRENASEKERRVAAEKREGEEKRVNAFDSAIADVPFVSPKARQQFRDAYLQKVVADDDGNFVVNTDKGPMAYADFLKSEAESSAHLLAPQGSGGSGATAGTKPRGGTRIDIANMSVADIAALPLAKQNELMKEYSS